MNSEALRHHALQHSTNLRRTGPLGLPGRLMVLAGTLGPQLHSFFKERCGASRQDAACNARRCDSGHTGVLNTHWKVDSIKVSFLGTVWLRPQGGLIASSAFFNLLAASARQPVHLGVLVYSFGFFSPALDNCCRDCAENVDSTTPLATIRCMLLYLQIRARPVPTRVISRHHHCSTPINAARNVAS